MPIPSLSSAVKARTQPSRAKDLNLSSDSANSDVVASSEVQIAKLTPQSPSIPGRGNVGDTKRRSYLPQRGDTKTSSRQKLGGDMARAREPDGLPQGRMNNSAASSVGSSLPQSGRQVLLRSRPRSVYQISLTASERDGGRLEGGGDNEGLVSPVAVSKSAVLELPAMKRSHSLRKPDSATGHTHDSNTSAHSRTQSTSAAMASQKAQMLPRSRLDRPKSLLVPPSNSTKGTLNPPTSAGPSEPKSSTRSAMLNRSVSMRNKLETTAAAHATTPLEQPARTVGSSRREPAREEIKRQARPAFSTMQQHFTPRKGTKAPTSTFLHPAAQDTGAHNLPPEVIALQSDLLQLHVLHQASTQTVLEWKRSAVQALRQKFDEAASLYQAMREHERHHQEQKNLISLREWSNGSSSIGLLEQIHLLSGPLHELPALTEPGGRVTRLADEFSLWLAWVQKTRSAREADGPGQSGSLDSVEGLGDAWKAENGALARKLTAYLRDLDKLSQPNPGSSIGCIVTSCKELLGLILDELHTMQTIEADVVAREQEFIEGRLGMIGRDINTYLEDYNTDNLAWRR